MTAVFSVDKHSIENPHNTVNIISIDAHPVEAFKVMALSTTSANFTWNVPITRPNLITGYSLRCIPLLAGIPALESQMVDSDLTSAVITGLHPGVPYDCSITTNTAGGHSQPRSINLTTHEIGNP